MMHKLFSFLTIAFLLVTPMLHAQSKQEQNVTAAVEKLRTAMISGEREALNAITADALSYGHSSGTVENKTQFVEKIASGQSDFVSITLSKQTISVTGKTAVVRHHLVAATNDGGKPGTVKLDILLVWQKIKGSWKLLARQAVKGS